MRNALKNPAFRAVMLVVGLLLIVAAVVIATRQVDFTRLADAPWWLLPAMAACVIVNQTLASWLVCLQTRSFEMTTPISQTRMWQLTAGSRLLNFLPMQAGLLGRATYLHLRHGMPVKQTGLSILVTFGYGVAIVLPLGVLAILMPAAQRLMAIVSASVLLIVLFPLLAGVMHKLVRRRPVMAWAWAPLRLVDLFVNALKTYLAFRAMGVEITFAQAVGLKAVGVLIEMVGLTPHGLGLREWAVTAVSHITHIATAPQALAATLIERGIDAVMTVIMGLIGLAGLRNAKTTPVCDADAEAP